MLSTEDDEGRLACLGRGGGLSSCLVRERWREKRLRESEERDGRLASVDGLEMVLRRADAGAGAGAAGAGAGAGAGTGVAGGGRAGGLRGALTGHITASVISWDWGRAGHWGPRKRWGRERGMSRDCFTMGVRVLTRSEGDETGIGGGGVDGGGPG